MYNTIRVPSVRGRYVNPEAIQPFLNSCMGSCTLSVQGSSVQGRPLYVLRVGSGSCRVLMWSQMHGNESTTTRAVLDLIAFLGSGTELAVRILEACTLTILPMLNPDGAEVYTRVNANEIDLNRDARMLSQPESRTLRKVFKAFKPDYCFNLHDQRSIFNVGETGKPATVSFLAPAMDAGRSVSDSRAESMRLIAAINEGLQQWIPGQVGRYDDTFNPDCVGDSFQALHTPTLLFEAGHYPGDYEREYSRRLIFESLLLALHTLAADRTGQYGIEAYHAIPENRKGFLDVLIRNAHLLHKKWPVDKEVGVLYKETLEKGRIIFEPHFEELLSPGEKFGHQTYDCRLTEDLKTLKENRKIFELLQ